MISLEENRSLIIKSLGMKPKNGGKPPRENNDIKDKIFILVFGIDLSCLKWNTWFLLSNKTTEDDTIE